MDAVNEDKVQKLLNLAGHAGTGDHEALNALRALRGVLSRGGKTLADLRFQESVSRSLVAPNALKLMQQVEALELTVTRQDEQIKTLTRENRELQKKKGKAVAIVEPAPAPVEEPKNKTRRGNPASIYTWTREMEEKVYDLFLQGLSQKQIATSLGWTAETPHNQIPNPEQILNKTWNQKPPAWLNAEARLDGPMSWLEFWLIGSELCGGGNGKSAKGWYKRALARVGLDDRDKQRFGVDGFIEADAAKLAAFRNDYFSA